MKRIERTKLLRSAAIVLVVSLWTTAAGFAAPTRDANATLRLPPAANANVATARSTDAPYRALERVALALRPVQVPTAAGALPRLRGGNAAQIAAQVLAESAGLRDRDALDTAVRSAGNGPDDGRAGVLADLVAHHAAFRAALDRLDAAQATNDAPNRFSALVELARLLDAQPHASAKPKFNPATVRGQLADTAKVRKPLLSAVDFNAAKLTQGVTSTALSKNLALAKDLPGPGDLAETDEVRLTTNIRNQAQALGNNPVAIRNWVYNNIDFVPSFGSTQNSQRTLFAGRGNAFDTSSLLIALLRAANIPARYVFGTVDLPADKVRNWLGDLPDANAAADLLTKSGIPTTVVTSGGTIKTLRIEHVWVEAYVDFSPSRGAKNAAPDTWVPMDASFKSYTRVAGLPVATQVTLDAQTAQTQMLAGAKRGADWITGIDPAAVQRVNDQVTQQVSTYLNAQGTIGQDAVFGKRSIAPNNSALLEGSLPYALASAQIYRYDALPGTLQHTISVSLYDSTFDVDGDSPEFSVSMPLARLGTDSLRVEYRGASAADATLMKQYVASNSASVAAQSLNVVPQLKQGGSLLLKEGASVAYGTQQYWRVAIADPAGAFPTATDPSVFPAGTAMAFVVDTTGTTPAYTEALTAGMDNTANLPMGDALSFGGLQYFLLHDMFDDMVAEAHHAAVVRLPSVGAFATALRVSYFFGVPRTATTEGFQTDVKGLHYAVGAPSAEEGVRALSQLGALGSLSEGMTWSLLTGRDVGGSLSAATLLLRANEAQIPIYLLNSSNINQDLPSLALSDDDKSDIQNAVAAGENVLVPARELTIAGWSGVGYLVLDPATGAGIWRVSGGLNGAIDEGCIAQAISLNVLCKLMFNKLLREFIAKLNPAALLAKLAEKALVALVPVVGEIIAVVQLALEIIDITMTVLRWVRGIMNMIEALQQGDLEQLGITALNDLICSIGSPCFGGGFGGFGGGFGGGGPGEPALGNPISVGNGIKWQWERDYDGDGPYPLHFVRTYNSALINGSVTGNKWSHTYQSSIHVAPAPLGDDTTPATAVSAVLVQHGDGTYAQYNRNGNVYVAESNLPEPLVRLTDSAGNTAGWEVTRLSDEVEHFDATGRLQWVRNRAGLRHTLSYNANNQLTGVSDDFGRSLAFGYDATSGQLTSMTDPDGKVYTYGYDANGNATSVTYPDQKSRTYLYEDVMLNSHLTGIVDERGVRYATFAYDYRGRASLSTHTGGAGKIAVSYGDNTATVTDAIGTVRTYSYTLINQRPYLVEVDQPCSAGCAGGGVSKQTFDANGFVQTRTDFNGNVTTLSHNARGLIENRTEATGTPLARSSSATWHATYHLPTQINEPLPDGTTRTNVYGYDSAGNLTDLTATAGSDVRHWHNTFNAHGQVLTAKNPRTDVDTTVKYSYDDATGNRLTMTDALGHVTRYTQYDAHGRLKQKIDPNGLITNLGYDLRGRLTSVNEQTSASDAGETTQFGYDAAGELTQITLPDGSYLKYTFDDAQRLTDIGDSLGNAVHFTLDGLDTRIGEDTKDPNGTLAQTLSRVVDALGRMKELHGANANEITAYQYDNVGNEQAVTDPLSHATSSTYDALNRLTHTDVLDASDAAHAAIGYGYDVRDNLTSVTDPRNLVTNYVYSGFDELKTLTSPDTGKTQYGYDADGNLTLQTDARNTRAVYAYDASERLAQVQYGAAAASGNGLASVEETLSFGYDEASGGPGAIDRLTHADVSGTPLGSNHTAYQYDTHGRVTQKMQQLASNSPLTLNTQYNALGQKDQVTLPSGAVIGYSYGADGRVVTITVNGVTIVKDVQYFPFGDVASWTENNPNGGAPYTRGYDTDGRVTSFRDGSVSRHLGYDAASRVTALVDNGSAVTANWTFGYDDQDRLTSASNAAMSGATLNLSEGFAYDATGNRTSATTGSSTTAYTTDPASNRLSQVGSVSRSYDAAGNTLSDGAHGYVYSARNRLKQSTLPGNIPLASYAYNAWGERIAKQGSSTTQFVYDDDGHLIGEYDTSGKLAQETVWIDDTPVAVLKLRTGASNGSPTGSGSDTAWQGLKAGGVDVYWIESDQLDTPRAIVNANHQLVWHWDSDPFGTTAPDQTPSSGSGISAAFVYNLRFPGQYFDQETGTEYNYFRDYDAGTGRYLESDPIGLSGGLDTYVYVDSKPFTDYDPTGLIGVPKPGKGKGTVPKPQRDKKRVWTTCENQAKLAKQGGVCPICGSAIPMSMARGHHIVRHADGGKTDDANHIVLCDPCHKDIHR